MMPQRGQVHALHFPDLVVGLQKVVIREDSVKLFFLILVYHSPTLAHQHWVVCSLQHLGQKHLEYLKQSRALKIR